MRLGASERIGIAGSGTDDTVRPVTSLFADVVGSTSLGERLGTSEVKALIGECVTRMCEAVEAFGGYVGAYMGDGVAAFFGLESTRERDAECAVRAALEIRSMIEGYSKEVETAWGVSNFNVRVGVNTGRVAVGLVGAGEPQVLALGDAVNVAARLQSSARPGTILIGAPTAEGLSDRFTLRPVASIQVKGRVGLVAAFEIESERPAGAKTFRAPFVGRRSEQSVLVGLLEELAVGRGQACVVVGEAGTGKSRLLEQIRSNTPSETMWLDCRCDSNDQRFPYEPFVQAIRAWLGVDERTPAIETRVKLAARGQELLGGSYRQTAPHLARLLGIGLSDRLDGQLEGLPPDVLTRDLQRAFSDWLIALAVTSPVVLAVDNFGVASQAAVDLASTILEAVEHAPILVLLTMRPTPTERGWRARVRALADFPHRTTELRLVPLDEAESAALVNSIDEQEMLDPRLREIVISRAEGNPLYIEELIAAVSHVPMDDHSLSTSLPIQLESLLLSRIDALPKEAREVLQATAVLGRTFAKDVLDGMSIVANLDSAIAPLLKSDIVRERGRLPAEYGFRHGLLREAALSTLTPGALRSLNERAAAALRAWCEFDYSRDLEALARHYLAADDMAQAVECLEGIADRMTMIYQFQDAEEIYRQCLDHLRPIATPADYVRVARKLAVVLRTRGKIEALIELLEEVQQVATSEDDRAGVATVKAEALAEIGERDAAVVLISDALRSITDRDLQTTLWLSLGKVALSGADVGMVDRCLKAAAGHEETGRPDVDFDSASLRAGRWAMAGDLDEAEHWALKAQAFADRTGRATQSLTAKRHVAIICLLKGCVRESYELMKTIMSTYERYQHSPGILETGVNLVHISCLVGELDYGSTLGEKLLTVAPGPVWEGLIAANLAVIKLERGEFERAEELAKRSLELSDEASGLHPGAVSVLAAVLHQAGDVENARRLLTDALDHPSARGADVTAVLHGLLAELALENRDVQAAELHVNAARGSIPESERVFSAHLDWCEGVIATIRDVDGAGRRLMDVLELTRQMGLRLQEARTLVALGSLGGERSEQHFSDAEAIFETSDCKRGLAELAVARIRPLVAADN